jgi:hypothetical protein
MIKYVLLVLILISFFWAKESLEACIGGGHIRASAKMGLSMLIHLLMIFYIFYLGGKEGEIIIEICK